MPSELQSLDIGNLSFECEKVVQVGLGDIVRLINLGHPCSDTETRFAIERSPLPDGATRKNDIPLSPAFGLQEILIAESFKCEIGEVTRLFKKKTDRT